MTASTADRPFFTTFVTCWVPVALYVTAILVVSAQSGLRPPPGLMLSDKFYHFVEYGGLGLLLGRALRATLRTRLPIVAALIAIAIGGAMGLADEWFQSFVPGRDSSLFDALADVTGVLFAQIAYMFAVRE
ncbi:MAG: VanZ family protein [Candidatus Eisenbacteria bacterium]|nr:VanZ family protein [Candidatus Eisenbacteria bacterium]